MPPDSPTNFDDCGLAQTLKVIGSKWTLAIIYELGPEAKRFNNLQKRLNVSPRTLSARLQQLEKNGVIERTVLTKMPLQVEYSLTDKGRSLDKIVKSMGEWGEKTQTSLQKDIARSE